MKIEDHEIHEYENTKIMKTMKSTKEIHITRIWKRGCRKICELYEMCIYKIKNPDLKAYWESGCDSKVLKLLVNNFLMCDESLFALNAEE